MHVNLQMTPNRPDFRSTDNVDSRKQHVIDTFRHLVRTRSASRVFRVPSILLLLVASATPLLAQVQITEFMASNTQTLRDDFGQYEDWIEIYNNSASAVNLLDWALTDNPDNWYKWRFPSTNLPPKTFLVVFASNRDRHTPGLPLHTNFKLGAEGEFLALVRPDGFISTQFSAPYPPQAPDVSFGFGVKTAGDLLVTTNSTGRVRVPASGGLGTNWTAAGFNDRYLAGRDERDRF